MGIAEPKVDVPAGNAKKGAKLYKGKCAQCHTIDQGGASKTGPNLHGFVDKPAGNIAGYGYSDSLKNSGIVWTDKHLWEFLLNPKKHLPGTTMVFPGIKKETERADLIAYLVQESNK